MATATPAALEPAAPEVKRYERQKLTATVVNAALGLAALAVGALLLGPWVNDQVRRVSGDNDLLCLVAIGFVYAAVLELLTLKGRVARAAVAPGGRPAPSCGWDKTILLWQLPD